ncbi:multidrug transporter [Streptomyces sp. PLAI1-29]|uniref:Multidrug transporter n=1 Tax=Streptomyces zingiberis TaxID=2053010 RepID=A0ABX1C2U8_9ACTN|nr:multidrug transporter [Streptomyces zingiberis]
MRRGPAAGVTGVVLATAAALLLGAVPPAAAADTDPRPLTRADVLRPVAPPPAGTPTGAGAAERPGTAAEPDGALETSRTTRPVAPGVDLTSFDRLTPGAWLRADALSVDLRGGARVDHLSSGEVTRPGTVSALVSAHDPGPGRTTVAAVNADFFDLGTGAPLGPGLRDGAFVTAPGGANRTVAGFGPDDAGRILDLYFDGTLTLPAGDRPLDAYNPASVPAGGIALYTPQWGGADRAQAVAGAERVTEVVLAGGVVREVRTTPGGRVEEGTTVLLGREAGAGALAALAPGDRAGVEYRPRTGGGPVPRTAVGGRGLVVVDGEPQDWEGRPNNAAAPRTAVGFSRDGSTVHVLTVDGRQADSGGVTLTQLGRMMRELGAHNALNLDGGGSSTLLARAAGESAPRLENSPSDGRERPVANGLAVTVPTGGGRPAGIRVETATAAGDAPTTGPVRGGRPDRVFPGLTRSLRATVHDETYGPAAGRPRWTVRPGGAGAAGRVDGAGVFTARRSGTAEVEARLGAARGSVALSVIGPLDRIVPTTPRVGLADADATGVFGLTGLDAQGTEAPVEPADVALEYDRSLFTVVPDGRGSFTVTAKRDGGSGRIEATAGGRTAVVGVTVGLTERTVAAFDDAGRWTFSQARAEGSVAPDPDGRDGTGLRLAYDFTRSTATRAAYANPPEPVPVAGQPQAFRLWLKGDGHGAWPSLHLLDAQNTDLVLRAPFVTWTGWRQVEFAVPPGTVHPLRVRRLYLAETDPLRQYTGEVVLDGLTALVPPDVDLPAAGPVPDRLIGTGAETARRDWRFAVLSDAQFTARDPDGPIVRQARRTLREIRAAAPDLVLVNGDLVDEGSAADLALARRVLEEELGDAVEWTYVPGNHEVMGGSTELFEREFGPAHRVLDHRGTRFLTLDTSSLSLRGGGLGQLRGLRAELDRAARDAAVGSVVVVQHVPPRDPTPQRASQLSDPKEAALLESWLAGFRRASGKGAALITGHAGVFHASRTDGVPCLVNGNSGKAPAAPPGRGGFTGWSLAGVDRVSEAERDRARQRPWEGGPDWLTVQTRPHVDGLRLDGPAGLPAGSTARVTATVLQGEGGTARAVPVGFPLSADWTGSPRLRIGPADGAGPRHVAAYDPATGVLTALRPGKATLSVTVNGVTERTELRVAAPAAGGGGERGADAA